jgi:hypothetical protein
MATKKSLKKANNKKAKFINHQSVSEWLASWGSPFHTTIQWPEAFKITNN